MPDPRTLLCLLVLPCLLVVFASSPAKSQTLPIVNEFTIPGNVSLVRLGDIDGDGCDDFYHSTQNGVGSTWTMTREFVSGMNGTTFLSLSDVTSTSSTTNDLTTRFLGDLDGDGDGEFATLSQQSWSIGTIVSYSIHVKIQSGSNGDVVWSFDPTMLGIGSYNQISLSLYSIVNLGDIDGDGVCEVGIQWGYIPPPSVGGPRTVFMILNPLTQVVVHQILYYPGTAIPWDFRPLDDVNSDGITDILVSTRAGLMQSGGGSVGVLSGADLSLLRYWTGTQMNEFLGEAVAWVEDLDGDAVRDAVLAAPGHMVGGVQVGQITAYSSATGALLWQTTGVIAESYPGSLLESDWQAAPDFNGDGFRDFVAYTHPVDGFPRTPAVLSGIDGTLLDLPLAPGDYGYLFHAEDCNGDGISETIGREVFPPLVPGMPLDPNTVSTFRFYQDIGVQAYGAATLGSSLSCEWHPYISLPRAGQIELHGATPGASLWLGLSLAAGNGALIQGQHPLWISQGVGDSFGVIPLFADASGSFIAPLSLLQPGFDGISLYAQFAQLTQPDSLSNGLQILFGD